MSTSKYRSKFEQKIADNLRSGNIDFDYEQATFTYVREHKYLTDFRIQGTLGPIYIESKGRFTSSDRTKLIAVRAQNPGLDIRLLFQRSTNTLSKTSKTTYAAWADKNGFAWAEGTTIPKEWLP